MRSWRTTPPPPTGVTELDRLRYLAWICDTCFRVPGLGLRFGADALIGLIPGLGDAIGGAVAAWGIIVAARLGVPGAVLVRMLLNVTTDVVLGSVPLLGDLFDLGWKAHTRNVAILERWQAHPEGTRRASRWILVGVLLTLLLSFVAALVIAGWLILFVVRRITA